MDPAGRTYGNIAAVNVVARVMHHAGTAGWQRAHLESDDLADSQARAVGQRQRGLMIDLSDAAEQAGHFFFTQHQW
ncbi:hypothetical protein [Candidatus Skiveiella danica]|uniref:hypothetical protein n=1 Tax=Candidatus Skiveiella danica TaxID=3386177 RepID=UPI0039B9B8DD